MKEKEEAKQIIDDLIRDFKIVDVQRTTVVKAIDISIKHGFSYWDSLIIGAALENDCTVLYTEDMQHNQIIEDKLRITNPFIV